MRCANNIFHKNIMLYIMLQTSSDKLGVKNINPDLPHWSCSGPTYPTNTQVFLSSHGTPINIGFNPTLQKIRYRGLLSFFFIWGEEESTLLYTLYIWTAGFVSPLVISYRNFLVIFSPNLVFSFVYFLYT